MVRARTADTAGTVVRVTDEVDVAVDAVALFQAALRRYPSPSAMLDVKPWVVRALHKQAEAGGELSATAAALLALCETWGARLDMTHTVLVCRGDAADILGED